MQRPPLPGTDLSASFNSRRRHTSGATAAKRRRDRQQAFRRQRPCSRAGSSTFPALFLRARRFCVAVSFNRLGEASSAEVTNWSKSSGGRRPECFVATDFDMTRPLA